MARLTDEARTRCEDYIRQVRGYLAAVGTAGPDDVVAELREHVERELKDADEPVSPESMQEVLTRLGQPSQWIGDEELPWWRKMILRIRTGPEDWRLAYATFGVLLLGVLLGWLFGDTYTSRWHKNHEFSWTVMFMFLAASFILARAGLVTAKGDSLPSGRKWLIYPSLVLPYAMILLLIVASVPIAVGAGGAGLSYESLIRQHSPGQPAGAYYPFPLNICNVKDRATRAVFFGVWAGTYAAGVWWIFLGVVLLFGRTRRAMEAVFAPFLRHMSRRWPVIALLVGLLLVLLATAAAIAAQRWNHVYF